MAWTGDWINFGELYEVKPYLEELRVGLVERTLSDPFDDSDLIHTEIEPLTEINETFFQKFEDYVDELFNPNTADFEQNYVQYWDSSGNWDGDDDIPVVSESSVMTRIGQARIPAPLAFGSLTKDWMLQQYDILNELRWMIGNVASWIPDGAGGPKWGSGVRPGFDQTFLLNRNFANSNPGSSSFAVEEAQANALYTAGNYDTSYGLTNHDSIDMLCRCFKVGSNFSVRYESLSGKLKWEVSDTYTSDLDFYIGVQTEGTNEGDLNGAYVYNDWGLSIDQSKIKLFDTDTGIIGGFSGDTHTSNLIGNKDEAIGPSINPDTIIGFSDVYTGWLTDRISGRLGGQSRIYPVMKFDVAGGFQKVT